MARTGSILSVAFVLTLAVFGGSARAQVQIYGIKTTTADSSSAGLSLVSFSSNAPGTINTIGSLTGLVSNHQLRTIDFRPSNGQLYALSTSPTSAASAQLYTVNLSTGALTTVGPGFTLGINGSLSVDMDFNPVTDVLRVVTGATTGTNNFRVSPTTGTLLGTDSTLAYVGGDPNNGNSPSVVAIAHSNNTAGASTTTLYAWDYFNSDTLARIGGPNGSPSPDGGGLQTVHLPTGLLAGFDGIGMDIGPASNTLFVTHDDPVSGVMGLYTRNLTTGVDTFLGAYPTNTFITSISVAPTPIPEPGLLIGCGLIAVGCVARRTRRA